jgi:protein-S-isoprenylcysteine O-methyltransferase Ste14
MKDRVKVDVMILLAVIIFSIVVFTVPKIYPPRGIDNVFDFFGLFLILLGTSLRMSARGHKMNNSQRGEKLVTTGPYLYVRNPMYLGSFLIGTGFVVIVLPFWIAPVFAWLFYQRFDKQMRAEEDVLASQFGDEYDVYCQRTPRVFPVFAKLRRLRIRETFNFREIALTQEQRGLWAWPVLAVVLEIIQEAVIYGQTDFRKAVAAFGISMVCYSVAYYILYRWT